MLRRPALMLAAALCAALVVVGCGGSSPTPQATLHAYLADWSRGDWGAMRSLVASPPSDFTAVNAGAFSALDVRGAALAVAGRVRQTGTRATAKVTERFALPGVGTWSPVTTVTLVHRHDRWLVDWSAATINPSLRAGDRLDATENWPGRAPILGAGGAPLTRQGQVVAVGVVGGRIRSASAVRTDLLAAGATPAQVSAALAAAKAHPSFFEPVFQVSVARFDQLKDENSPTNVYAVKGTEFQLTSTRSAITAQLGAHLVGTVGPITAQELAQLGPPYSAVDQVGQTGLEAADERRLAGTPTTRIVVMSAGGAVTGTLATFPGHAGTPVTTSIDPAVQRAAEAALSGVRHTVAMVAIRASTGQVLAAVSDPVSAGYDEALQGAFPPGSTFKVLTATALIRRGLTPTSPASCPPTLDVGGEVFHNAEGEAPVSDLDGAFTESCNTAFIGLATAHLTAAGFTAAARLYGLTRTPQLGLPGV